jgi:hypothetical protein
MLARCSAAEFFILWVGEIPASIICFPWGGLPPPDRTPNAGDRRPPAPFAGGARPPHSWGGLGGPPPAKTVNISIKKRRVRPASPVYAVFGACFLDMVGKGCSGYFSRPRPEAGTKYQTGRTRLSHTYLPRPRLGQNIRPVGPGWHPRARQTRAYPGRTRLSHTHMSTGANAEAPALSKSWFVPNLAPTLR